MVGAHTEHSECVVFETSPERYRHWQLEFPQEHAGAVARLVLDIPEDGGLVPGYPLKLNSYDLGVDIELADAIQRIRFEHPEVKAVVLTSGKERIFSSGANIYMLGSSTHSFKVNFCKFTNETRLALEELGAETGALSLAGINGTASGGGYELALACDEIVLVDDGSSAVSFPEAPLLAVLPGTGGLTRLVDKRKVRRDLADVFSTTAEGVRGKRAVAWGLVDEAPSKRELGACVKRRLDAMVARSKRAKGHAVALTPVESSRYVTLKLDTPRTATLTLRGPPDDHPRTPDDLAREGADAWAIRFWRELDLALLDLRFNRPGVTVVAVRSEGDPSRVLAVDEMLVSHEGDGLIREVTLLARRVLKRLECTAKSFFALVEPGSCFSGSLLEIALACDRVYMRADDEARNAVQTSPMNASRNGKPRLAMANGLTRLESRFLGAPERVSEVLDSGVLGAEQAHKLGIATFAPDDIDWDDEIRVAFEERASLSPDAMTGMEASLRFGGPETMETKIFARLSAWQNWIFQRSNAVGPKGALTLYGQPERPEFEFVRT
jgi:benzoyl-CoA-dihydrodiol lyase